MTNISYSIVMKTIFSFIIKNSCKFSSFSSFFNPERFLLFSISSSFFKISFLYLLGSISLNLLRILLISLILSSSRLLLKIFIPLIFAIRSSSSRDWFCISVIWFDSFCKSFWIFAIFFSPFSNNPFLLFYLCKYILQ